MTQYNQTRKRKNTYAEEHTHQIHGFRVGLFNRSFFKSIFDDTVKISVSSYAIYYTKR